MRKLIFLVVPFLFSSCVPAPKSVNEFREAMQSHPSMMKEESHTVNRNLSVVVKDLERKSKECLQFGYESTTRAGAAARSNAVLYHPHVRMSGKAKAEMFIQEEHIPAAIGSPKGGAYVFLADMKRVSSSKTKMTIYSPSFPTWQPIIDAVKGWSEGKNIKCPDSP
jgi:hypothetical protein